MAQPWPAAPPTQLSNEGALGTGMGGVPADPVTHQRALHHHYCYKSPVAVSFALRALAAAGRALLLSTGPEKPCAPCRALLWHSISGMARCPTCLNLLSPLVYPQSCMLVLMPTGHGIWCAFLQSHSLPKHRFGNGISKCHCPTAKNVTHVF